MQGQEKEADILNQSAYKIFAKGPAANQRFFPSAMFHIPGASYFSLASILEWIGNSEDALSLLIKTLNSREEALGANDQNVGTAACRLGEFYWNLDRLSEAETLYLKALKIFEASPEPQEPDQFCCRSSLRSLLLAMNRYDEAEKYDERLKIPGNQS
jgi:tetratricopeptide (TPR) repeat protein